MRPRYSGAHTLPNQSANANAHALSCFSSLSFSWACLVTPIYLRLGTPDHPPTASTHRREEIVLDLFYLLCLTWNLRLTRYLYRFASLFEKPSNSHLPSTYLALSTDTPESSDTYREPLMPRSAHIHP